MLWGGHAGELELRARGDGSHRLRGSFPYNKTATLSDGGRRGRPQKERIASRAFGFRVEDPKAEIHLLMGHSFDRPLASKLNGTLTLSDTLEALLFDAVIARSVASTSYGRDALSLIESGLAVGVSPGFRLPPARAVAKAETIEEEPIDPERGMHGATIRTVNEALLFEVSVVTRPAYDEAQVELRNWSLTDAPDATLRRALNRWRA